MLPDKTDPDTFWIHILNKKWAGKNKHILRRLVKENELQPNQVDWDAPSFEKDANLFKLKLLLPLNNPPKRPYIRALVFKSSENLNEAIKFGWIDSSHMYNGTVEPRYTLSLTQETIDGVHLLLDCMDRVGENNDDTNTDNTNITSNDKDKSNSKFGDIDVKP